MRQKLYRRGLALLLAGCALLSCASCGPKAEAATMHLRKTEGTVGVSDGEKAVEPREDLGLYSGYGVDTQTGSYAWIDLDEVKLTKLDQDSEIEIKKEDKRLTVEVKSGSLFFNVTQPLAEDEALDIRCSTMAVGIRGTCGWVEVNDPEHMTLCLLEGTVECSAGPVTTTVDAGKMAVMTVGTAAGNGIAVSELSAADIPAFVKTELDDPDMAELNSVLEQMEERGREADQARKAALLEALNSSSGASYAGLFDMDGDGREDLLVLNQIGDYARFRWTAYLWDGSAAQPVDLVHTSRYQYDTHTTDDIYTVTAGVCRERDTGTVYVRYYGEYVGGAYSNYYVSTAGSEEIPDPRRDGGFTGETAEEYEAWIQQQEQEQREYEAELANRFETLEELNVGGFDGAEDYTGTIGEVRQRLETE